VCARTGDNHRTVESGTQTNYLNINMHLFGYRNCKLSLASFKLFLDAFKLIGKKKTISPIMSAICLHRIERMAATNSREIYYLGIFLTFVDIFRSQSKSNKNKTL